MIAEAWYDVFARPSVQSRNDRRYNKPDMESKQGSFRKEKCMAADSHGKEAADAADGGLHDAQQPGIPDKRFGGESSIQTSTSYGHRKVSVRPNQ